MAKVLDFQTWNAEVADDDGDKHTSSVRAAVVPKELAGTEVLGRDGRSVKLNEGDAVVQTTNPDRYDVLTKVQWEEAGYSSATPPLVKGKAASSGPQKTPSNMPPLVKKAASSGPQS